MTQGRYARRSYPGTAVPFEQDVAVSSDSDAVFNTIQAAIDATAAGGRVAVGPGTFQENIDVGTQNVTVIGSGRGTVVDGADTGDAVTVSATGVRIANIAAQTTGGSNDAFHVEVPGDPIESNIQLINPIVLQADEDGIHVFRSSDVGIQGAVIESAQTHGIRANRRLNIDNATIYGTIFGVGVKLFRSDCRLSNVYVRNSRFAAFDLRSSANRTIMTGCKSLESQVEGLLIQGASDVFVSGCDFINSDEDDIEINGQANTGSSDIVLEGVGYESINLASDATRVADNGRWLPPTIPTIGLGGSDQEATPEVHTVIPRLDFLIDAGGSATTLQGLDPQNPASTSLAERGLTAYLWHTGGEDVTVEHGNGSATDPFNHPGSHNITLSSNDQWLGYVHDNTEWVLVARDPALVSIRNKGTEADAVAIGSGDSTGDVTVTVAHGLDVTPAAEDIQAFISGASQQDYAAYVKEIRNIGATNFDAVVHIDALSATANATADLSWAVNAGVAG